MSFCLPASPTAAQLFDPAKVGPPLSNAPAELYLPSGFAPEGAVVVLHGCNGVSPHDRWWARRLTEWGFAALLVDSFGPRGFTEVCNRGRLVPPAARARDAFDGAAYLRATPEVRASSPLETHTLILIGDADDWTPAARCARWRDAAQTNGHTLQMKTYPGTRHAFDALSAPHSFAGHYIGQDPAAMADSFIETRAFLSERLVPAR
jgi:dienelactone hydrolase